MSRPVPERLRELEADVRDLRVLPAAAIRARGRRRGRRQVAVLAAAGVVVVATAGVGFAAWSPRSAGPAPTGDRPAVSCVLTLPDSPAEVTVRVLDGGAAAGLARATARQLHDRGYRVVTDGQGTEPRAATLTYGPASIGAATLLRAMLHDEATMRFDPERQDRVVDLTVGPAFTRLATTIEVNQALVAIGEPTAPPQCSTGASPTPRR